MVNVVANVVAKQEFKIPVEWSVYDKVCVQANSLEEAYKYVKEHADEIPLGTDAEYIDGSYQIGVEDVEDCIMYQPINDVVCVSFTCDDLRKYVDSMLFDSYTQGGDDIAVGVFTFEGKDLEIALRVCGEVAVTYNGEVYHKPSEFPQELRKLIEAHPNDWSYYEPTETDDIGVYPNGEIYVGMNNWFEYISDNGGDLYECDLSEATPTDIIDDMTEIARQYFGIKKEGVA